MDFQKSMGFWEKNSNFNPEGKGWKWLKRWEEHWSTRAMPNGSLPDPSIIATQVQRVARWKAQSTPSHRNSGWMPAGPSALPPGANPGSQHGMGRINCIAFHPTDSNTFWVGVAQGGVWKTSDHGANWTPLTDELPILRISDIAVNPQNPDEMYISIGDYAYLAVALELDNRKRHTHYGIGVYKSTDGGQSWNPTALALNQTDRDASLTRRVLIHPNNPSELIAAGIYGIKKSYDGGDSWTSISDSIIWDIEQVPSQPHVIEVFDPPLSNDPIQADHWKASIFPNPHSGTFSLQLEGMDQEPIELILVDIMGRVVHQEQLYTNQRELQKTLSIQASSGMYFLKISQGNRSKVVRFQVKH